MGRLIQMSPVRRLMLTALMAVSLTSGVRAAVPALLADPVCHDCCPDVIRAAAPAHAPVGMPARCCVVSQAVPPAPSAVPLATSVSLPAPAASPVPAWGTPDLGRSHALGRGHDLPASPMPILQRTSVLLI